MVKVDNLDILFYKYKTFDFFGKAVNLHQNLYKFFSEQLNLFWLYKNAKTPFWSFVQQKHFLVFSLNFENIFLL